MKTENAKKFIAVRNNFAHTDKPDRQIYGVGETAKDAQWSAEASFFKSDLPDQMITLPVTDRLAEALSSGEGFKWTEKCEPLLNTFGGASPLRRWADIAV